MTSGWNDLVGLVRRWQSVERLDELERQDALRLAMMLGTGSVAGTLGCSVTMTDECDRFVTPVSDGELAIGLDQVQYESGRGPCLSAARLGLLILVDSMAGDRRWPELAAAARKQGVHRSMSVPLQLEGAAAALNFYGGTNASYSHPRSGDVARLVARCTAVLLGPGTRMQSADAARLDELALRRARIARAVEVVSRRDGVGATAAYRWLAVRSGELELPLARIVDDVLAQQPPTDRQEP